MVRIRLREIVAAIAAASPGCAELPVSQAVATEPVPARTAGEVAGVRRASHERRYPLGRVDARPDEILLDGPKSVEELINIALAENRGVQAARLKVRAFQERIPQVTTLDDTMVESAIWPFPDNGPQYSLMGYGPQGLSVTRRFPWFGTLRLRGEVAREEVREALAEFSAVQLETIAKVRRSYLDLAEAGSALEVLSKNRRLAERFAEIAEIRVSSGNGGNQEVLRARNLVTEVEAESARVEADRDVAKARLARLLHVSPESDLRVSTSSVSEKLPDDLAFLYRVAEELRPELRGMSASASKGAREVDLAGRKYFPDVTLGLGYMTMTKRNAASPAADGRDNFGLVVGFNIPSRRRVDAEVREARAKAAAAVLRFEDERDQTLEDVKTTFVEVKTRSRILDLFRSTYLPRGRLALESALAEYRAGSLRLSDLIASWREVLEIELRVVRLEADLGRAAASLERAVGARLRFEEPAAPPPPSVPAPPATESNGETETRSSVPQPPPPPPLSESPVSATPPPGRPNPRMIELDPTGGVARSRD